MTMTMTEREPLIKAFVKTLEEATNTPDLTGTKLECLRAVMDSLDIEPGTVTCVGSWEAMRVVGNGERGELVRVRFDGLMYTHKEFDSWCRACRPLWDYPMKNTAAEFIRRAAFVDANALLKDECSVEGKCKEPRRVQEVSKDYMTFDAGGECA